MRHRFNGTEIGRFDYGFDGLSRLKYEQRSGGSADGYGYDAGSEVTGFNRDGVLNNGTVTGGNLVAGLSYDYAGNRSQVTSNGTPTTWSANNLNQYTNTGAGSVSSDSKGNVQSYNGWSYTYDAQNRLRVAQNGSTRLEFWYDGLNRQIARASPGPSPRPRIA